MNQEYVKQHFFIRVNKVDSETGLLAICQNLYKVAHDYLSVTLEFIGYVQIDNFMQRLIHTSHLSVANFTV